MNDERTIPPQFLQKNTRSEICSRGLDGGLLGLMGRSELIAALEASERTEV